MIPSVVFAQASITGTVRDTSGAVLPGVTVEASSPALIEKVRTAVTDSTGQYRVIDLRPGPYSITFSLPGFSVVRRDGVQLAGDQTFNVSVELRVGALEETVTVTGESPIVDVQSVKRQTVVEGDTLKELPIARSYGTLFQLNPTATTGPGASRDVQVAPSMFVFGGPGGRGNEGRLQVDGLNVGAALNGGGVSSYVADVGNAQEVAMTTSGGLGEAEVGGPSISIVPRSGGNDLRGSFFVASVRDWMVGENLTQDLIDRGLGRAGDIVKLWDHNFGLGGPIVRDRLWYYGTIRDEGLYRNIPNMWANVHAGDPDARTYEADLTRPAVQAGSWTVYNLRLTGQATPRNRFSVFWDEQKPCEGGAALPDIDDACRTPDGTLPLDGRDSAYVIAGAAGASSGATGSTSAPEIATYRGRTPIGGGEFQRVQQARYTSTATNRLLLEAGLGTYISHWGGQEMPGNPTRNLVRVTEQCPARTGCADNGNIAGLTYRSANWSNNVMKNINWNAAASYVTGAHSMKFGYQGHNHITDGESHTNIHNLAYRVENGQPNQLTQNLTGAYIVKNRTRMDAFYAQEQWTMGRWTLQGALRYDYARSHFPEQVIEPTRFLPGGAVIAPEVGVRGFHDLSPRAGVAWDVFGTGKTAVKLNVGKYLEAATNQGLYTATNPISRLSSSVTRTWRDLNDNFVPDCDLLNLQANTGEDFCGRVSNLNFGQVQAANVTYDPALLGGWSVRPADWQIGASIQQEVLPRVSVEVGYTRRWLTNFQVTDNLAVSAGDFDTYSVTAPADPRLPNGGGQTISDLYNVKEAASGLNDNFVTFASNYGTQRQMYNGFLVSISARPRNGLTAQAGINVGRTERDTCEIRAALPETDETDPYCNWNDGWGPRITGLASYLVPGVDVSIAATFRSDQGQQLAANRAFGNAEIAPSLGRSLSGNDTNETINIVEPGTFFGDRINNVDMRFAKILRFGRMRTNVGVDIYNIFNNNPVLSYSQTFGATWLRPNSILSARFMKFSAQIDF